jgi:ABC-type antimicrobial peptide transport system permease subunit
MRAIGGSRRKMIGSVLVETVAIALVASVLGLAAGVGVGTLLAYLLRQYTVRYDVIVRAWWRTATADSQRQFAVHLVQLGAPSEHREQRRQERDTNKAATCVSAGAAFIMPVPEGTRTLTFCRRFPKLGWGVFVVVHRVLIGGLSSADLVRGHVATFVPVAPMRGTYGNPSSGPSSCVASR